MTATPLNIFQLTQSRGVITPLSGSKKRYKVDQFISRISNTLCVAIDQLRMPGVDKVVADHYRANLTASLAALSDDIGLSGADFAVGRAFSIADIFLYAVLTKMNSSDIQVQTSTFPNLHEYFERIANRADVKAAVLRMNTSPTETFPSENTKACSSWCISNMFLRPFPKGLYLK